MVTAVAEAAGQGSVLAHDQRTQEPGGGLPRRVLRVVKITIPKPGASAAKTACQ